MRGYKIHPQRKATFDILLFLVAAALAFAFFTSGVPALLIHHQNEPLEQAIEVIGAQPFGYVREALERSLSATGPGARDLGDHS